MQKIVLLTAALVIGSAAEPAVAAGARSSRAECDALNRIPAASARMRDAHSGELSIKAYYRT
jgi:hypothetical protein